MKLLLQFSPDQPDVVRSRLTYAFRVFNAIYGHAEIASGDTASADAVLTYAKGAPLRTGTPVVRIAPQYRLRRPEVPAPAPNSYFAVGESTIIMHGATCDGVDWLGEMFEWLSCADEYSVTARDPIGRIPFAKSYFGRHGLNPRVPYAAVAMRILQRQICRELPGASDAPHSPGGRSSHYIVNTHDVDFIPVSRCGSVSRLFRNAMISSLLRRDYTLTLAQVRHALVHLCGGSNPLDQINNLAKREVHEGLGASYLFIPSRNHRRDGNYSIHDTSVVRGMRFLRDIGMDIGVHGSYTSLDSIGKLAAEYDELRALGFTVLGGRQHWLRFTLPHLIRGIESAQAHYDASLGWTDQPGFRSGACFAHPLYNFDEERPARFLQLPVIMMDHGLCRAPGTADKPLDTAAGVLAQSRKYGWGGCSVLWHPTAFGGGQLPGSVADAFWALTTNASYISDRWVSAREFLRISESRYSQAGLHAVAAIA